MSKLTYEDKIEIYYKKKDGQLRYSLVKEYHIRDYNISYLIGLKI